MTEAPQRYATDKQVAYIWDLVRTKETAMNEQERQALTNLILNLWASWEHDSYRQIPEDRETHQFRDLEILRNYLERTAGCCWVHAKKENDHVC